MKETIFGNDFWYPRLRSMKFKARLKAKPPRPLPPYDGGRNYLDGYKFLLMSRLRGWAAIGEEYGRNWRNHADAFSERIADNKYVVDLLRAECQEKTFFRWLNEA